MINNNNNNSSRIGRKLETKWQGGDWHGGDPAWGGCLFADDNDSCDVTNTHSRCVLPLTVAS